MTLDEALAELGIEHDAGADQARRAYLRLLKSRKPETDPQGFMRLREAYDTVKERLEARDALFRAMGIAIPAPAPPAPPPPPPPAVEEPPPAAVEPPPPAPPDEAPPPPAAEPEPEAPPEAAAPDPAPAPEEDPEPDETEEPLADQATLDALCDEGRYTEAAAEMVRVFEAATSDLHAPPPPVLKALDLLVALHAEGAPAKKLFRSVAEWLRASGQEARLIRGDAAARWRLLHELASLPKKFPGQIRAAVARALQAGDLGRARRDRDVAVFHHVQPRAAREAAGMLRARAPLLAAAIADALDPPRIPALRASPEPQQGSGSKGGWAIAALVIGLLRVVMMLGRTSSTPSYNHTFDIPKYTFHLDAGVPYPLLDLDAGLRIPELPKLDPLEKARPAADAGRTTRRPVSAADAGRRGGTTQP